VPLQSTCHLGRFFMRGAAVHVNLASPNEMKRPWPVSASPDGRALPIVSSSSRPRLQPSSHDQIATDMITQETRRTKTETMGIIIALGVGLFLAALDMTIITTAIPTISSELNSTSGYIWVGAAYLLANASVVPIWGKISDIFGRKTIILCSAAVFLIGSALCGWSSSMPMLIAARAIQGIGGAGLITLPNIAVSDLFSERYRPKYLGLLGCWFPNPHTQPLR